MKINFREIVAPINFDGKTVTFDIARTVGNSMMYNGSVLLDIGFEDLAREIYYSDGAVEIPQKYLGAVVAVIKESNLLATVKREVLKQLQ